MREGIMIAIQAVLSGGGGEEGMAVQISDMTAYL
jgi:hypothetical protein